MIMNLESKITPHSLDYNGAEQLGVSRAQFTINNGERANTFAAFVRPILHRKNLTVITRALASRVIFHGTTATGVAFINGWGRFSPVCLCRDYLPSRDTETRY